MRKLSIPQNQGKKEKRKKPKSKSYYSKALDVNLTCGKTYLRTFDEELNF